MKLRCAIDDEERLAALHEYDILDTPPEPEYDRVALLLRSGCNVAISTITLIDRSRQWFKSHPGLDPAEGSRASSFCSVAMHLAQPLVVDDARLDRRFAHNELVVGEPHIRFYAGAPIVSSEGFPLGAVCLIDMEPRTLFPAQLQLLAHARNWVQASLELRRLNRIIAQSAEKPSDSLRAVEKWKSFAQYRATDGLNLFLKHHAQHNAPRVISSRFPWDAPPDAGQPPVPSPS